MFIDPNSSFTTLWKVDIIGVYRENESGKTAAVEPLLSNNHEAALPKVNNREALFGLVKCFIILNLIKNIG